MERLLNLFDGLSPAAVYGLLGLVSFIEAIFPPAPADLLVALGSFLAARQEMNLGFTITGIVAALHAVVIIRGYSRICGDTSDETQTGTPSAARRCSARSWKAGTPSHR